MRILEIISSLNPNGGGPIEGVKQLASVNIANGHQIEIACLESPDSPYIKSVPFPVHALGPGFLKYSYSSRFVPWLRRNAPKFDAVVINGLWQYSSFGAWRALHSGAVPYLIFTHGQLDPWFKHQYPLKHLKKRLYWPWAEYRVLRDARAVLFTSKEEKELVRQSFSPFPDNGVVVGYGTASPKGDPQAEREAFFARYPELRGKRLAVFLGRLHAKKGCDLLIQAFSSVLAKDACWSLVMAGPDETGWQTELSAMAQRLGISERITWTGMVSGLMKWGILRVAEVFVLPSHSENFGISVVEALACGVPVLISTRVNIWREIADDGAGIVAPDTLAGTVQLLQDWIGFSPEAQRNMRDRTVPCFMEHFEAKRAASRLIETLQQISERQPAC